MRLSGKCEGCTCGMRAVKQCECHQGGVTVDRDCDSPKGGLKDTIKVCQLVVRCDGHGGDVMRLWGGVTVVSKCGSSKGSMCDGHGGGGVENVREV